MHSSYRAVRDSGPRSDSTTSLPNQGAELVSAVKPAVPGSGANVSPEWLRAASRWSALLGRVQAAIGLASSDMDGKEWPKPDYKVVWPPGLDEQNPDLIFLQRLYGNCEFVGSDQQNRLSIPRYMREWANLREGETAIILGNGTRLEIWSRPNWEAYSRGFTSEKAASASRARRRPSSTNSSGPSGSATDAAITTSPVASTSAARNLLVSEST